MTTVLNPEIEMADPHLLVDEGNQQLDFRAAPLRHFQLESAGKMQRFDIKHPGVGDLIVGPFAGDEDCDFLIARALEGPAVGRCYPLDDIERIHTWLLGKVDK
jgi:hypothetical protein